MLKNTKPDNILKGDTKQVKYLIIKHKSDIKVNSIKKLLIESIFLKTGSVKLSNATSIS